MGGYDELGMTFCLQPLQQFQESHLARGRKRGLGFVEKVEPLDVITTAKVTQDRLAVRQRIEDVTTVVL